MERRNPKTNRAPNVGSDSVEEARDMFFSNIPLFNCSVYSTVYSIVYSTVERIGGRASVRTCGWADPFKSCFDKLHQECSVS